MTSAAQYKKHTHREHILELPDTYIGSVETSVESRWVWNTTKQGMEWRTVRFCPGFLKIFDEILVNALDHRVRQNVRLATVADAAPVKHIDVTLTPERITLKNDGDGIPVEHHAETGIWAPELIFGHLLTSSNYDKEEEKTVGGKNGYGSKCLALTTPVLLWNGTVKPASNVVVGDRLIGDDGTPRTVLSTLRGTGQLYKVNQAHAEPYIVNDAHTLTLIMPDHKVIFWNSGKNGWTMLWWDHLRKSICAKTIQVSKATGITCTECGETLASNIQRHYRRLKALPIKDRASPHSVTEPAESEATRSARIELETFAKTITDKNVFDMTICEFMALGPTTQKRLAGVRGACVAWKHQYVVLDPYVLGLWLGDGYACYGEKDPELIEYLDQWGAKNDATFTKSKKQLEEYDLINNKHIPAAYLQNDRNTRLKVLAGIIDTDGHVSRKGTRISITQGEVHKTLAENIVYLARSLGFAVTSHLRNVSYKYKGESLTSKAYTINISGQHIGDIPTLLPRKRCVGTVAHATDTTTGSLTIEKAGVNEYVGIAINGNQRFLINDFTVTHNCTNIFSSSFTIDTVDHRQKKKYVQTWTSNMSIVAPPKVTASSAKPYTEISYVPDLSRFQWSSVGVVPTTIPEDMLALIATRVVDAAACAGKDCRVTLNGVLLANNTFPKYIGLYLPDDAKRVAYEVAGERWEIGAILTSELYGDSSAKEPPKERHISFVNGIATRRGGKHLDYVAEHVLADFCELAKKKAKIEITPALLRDSVTWFVNSTIVNPSFDTQTKETLTTPVGKFGSRPVYTPKLLDQLIKIGLLEEAQALLEAKTAKDAKKTDGKKKSTVRGIPKLDDATWAGTAKSAECTLILTEGDSAKTTAISGLKVVGRDKYGVFPLKGKILNVKDISVDKKLKNQELTYIKQILGLEAGKVYTDLKQLRYGRVMIMTDQDVDGSHIKGLLMNLFHTEWIELLRLGFLCCLMTPLLKATKGATVMSFYSESEYTAWKIALGETGLRGWSTKYYKGLGTSTASEARDYFTTMNTVEYIWDETTDTTIDLAFNKKRADDRKTWLGGFSKDRHLEIPAGGAKVGYTRFVNDELIHFSNADNIRSLPHVMDGLKPSQRKIFWSALKRNLTKEIRVAQLAGYVSETAAYHHGEASLTGAIVGMAQNFVGSNNLNLLAPNGQFGTRLMGGEDAASARYIHTELMPIVRALVKKEDDAILNYLDDDGLAVEPETYFPVIPLLLVNGALGIGTGFSTNILPYNPVDLVGALRFRLSGGCADLSSVEMTPWWFGFKGKVLSAGDGRTWITKGLYEFADDDTATIRIKELPVGCWTQDYKNLLEEMLVEQETIMNKYILDVKKAKDAKTEAPAKPVVWLRGYTSNYNDVDVDFELSMDPEYYHEARAYPADFETRFKLTTSYKTSNMVAFDTTGKIRRYASAGEIIEQFYKRRLSAYSERKSHMLATMATEITELEARLTFVRAVVERRLVVANAEDTELLSGLQALLLPALSGGEGLKGYEYLLRMRVDRLKASAVAELDAEVTALKGKRDLLEATSVETLWLTDLDTFASAWADYIAWRNATYVSTTEVKKSAPRKARITKSRT